MRERYGAVSHITIHLKFCRSFFCRRLHDSFPLIFDVITPFCSWRPLTRTAVRHEYNARWHKIPYSVRFVKFRRDASLATSICIFSIQLIVTMLWITRVLWQWAMHLICIVYTKHQIKCIVITAVAQTNKLNWQQNNCGFSQNARASHKDNVTLMYRLLDLNACYTWMVKLFRLPYHKTYFTKPSSQFLYFRWISMCVSEHLHACMRQLWRIFNIQHPYHRCVLFYT